MFGFMFGEVAYLSDVDKIPDRTRELIKSCGLLIIDMLRLKVKSTIELRTLDTLSPEAQEKHSSHFILEQTLEEIRLIRPRRSLLVGMNHTVEHESTNRQLQQLIEEGLDVQLAYDGQRVAVDLGL